jgi:hypothetical protein
MDILLTHGYFLHEDPKELQIMKPYAPLGLLYLSSYLRGAGFEVETYDSTFGSRDALFRMLETEQPATLGIYTNLMTRANALAILEHALQCGWRVDGRSGTRQLCGQYPPPARTWWSRVRANSRWKPPARRAAGTDSRPVFRDAGGRTVNTGPARLLADLDAQPGRIANASISTAT